MFINLLICLRKNLDLTVLELEKFSFVHDKSYGPVNFNKDEVAIRGEIPNDKIIDIKKLPNVVSVWNNGKIAHTH